MKHNGQSYGLTLWKEAKEGAPHVVDAIPAVEPLLRLGQQGRGQEAGEEDVQRAEALLAQVSDAAAQSRQARAESRKKGSVH